MHLWLTFELNVSCIIRIYGVLYLRVLLLRRLDSHVQTNKYRTKPNILVKITLTQTIKVISRYIYYLVPLADKFEEKYRNTYSHFQTTPKHAISRRRVKGDGRIQILRMRTLLPTV